MHLIAASCQRGQENLRESHAKQICTKVHLCCRFHPLLYFPANEQTYFNRSEEQKLYQAAGLKNKLAKLRRCVSRVHFFKIYTLEKSWYNDESFPIHRPNDISNCRKGEKESRKRKKQEKEEEINLVGNQLGCLLPIITKYQRQQLTLRGPRKQHWMIKETTMACSLGCYCPDICKCAQNIGSCIVWMNAVFSCSSISCNWHIPNRIRW